MRRVDRIFFFGEGLDLEQVLDRGYRKCGGSTAFFFFGEGLDLEQVLAELTENAERDRDCCLQLIDGNEGVAGLFFL